MPETATRLPNIPNRYALIGPLGRGGSGSVYLVHDSTRQMDLALKIVGSEEREWLRREFDVLRRIRHENLIQVFDWSNLESGDAYYTMELVVGGDWSKRKERRSAILEVREILSGILRGLAHLHSHNEIHGDLKPGNILLGPGGLVKVADVGMGARNDGSRSGTPGYTAPEVWEGGKADERSDIYSLGVLAYEALTGKHPFAGLTIRDVVSEQLRGVAQSPSSLIADLPPALDRAVTKAMERDPRLRYSSADEFMESIGISDRIGEILDGQFTDRTMEIQHLEGLIHHRPPSPTLSLITGPNGIGKTYLMKELGDRASRRGAHVIELPEYVSTVNDISAILEQHLNESMDLGQAESGRVSGLAERMWDVGERSELLFLIDAPSEGSDRIEAVFTIARYLWALSQERKKPANVFFLIATESCTEDREFAETLTLQPFGEAETWTQVCSLLGTVRSNPGVRTQLHQLSGGNPGIVRSAIADLLAIGALTRLGGEWFFREGIRLDSLELGSTSGSLRKSWGGLSEELKTALLECAILADGLSIEEGRAKSQTATLNELLAVLQAKDWVRHHEGRWRIASELARAVVLDLAGENAVRHAARQRLARLGENATEDQVGDLVYHAGADQRTLPLAIGSAERAIARGANRLAATRLSKLIQEARVIGDTKSVVESSLMLAQAFHSLGKDIDAANALMDVPPKTDESSEARVALLNGQIQRGLGNLAGARLSYDRAVSSAGQRDKKILLRAHAALAELDWELGGVSERADAMSRIRAVLGETEHDAGLSEERSALFYGLGAALIRAGDRQTAKTVLAQGMEECDSDYWRMRLANALGSASLYLSELDEAMRWANQALDFAESAGVDAFRPRILANRGAVLYVLGKFKESANEDRDAALWAERLGNLFESSAGHAGAAVNLILLAKYEDGLHEASLSLSSGERVGDRRMVGKAREIAGLAYFLIGDVAKAEAEARQGAMILEKREYVDVLPRIDWLVAKILLRKGQEPEGIDLLRSAERGLTETLDLEDLWGVQIELNSALAKRGDPEDYRVKIRRICEDANAKGIVVVEVTGAVALAEIRKTMGMRDREDAGLINRALARAEESGMLEGSWQLSFHLGMMAAQVGDGDTARTRYMHASRVLREIAGELTPAHRHSYLARPDVLEAINHMQKRD